MRRTDRRACLLLSALALTTACGRPSAGQNGAAPRYRIAYSTYVGGSEFDQGREVILYPDGSVLIGGQTNSQNIPMLPGAAQPKYAGDDPALGPGGLYGGDCYLARLSPDGSKLLAATYFGGSKQERNVYGMLLDRQGNVVITTSTRSTDLPTTPGSFQPKYGGGDSDMMAAKLSADLKRILWCTYVGGASGESPRGGLALDAEDNVYLVGETNSPNFPVTPGAYQTKANGTQDAVLVKLKVDGSGLVFSTRLGGSNGEGSMGARVDTSGIYVSGHTQSPDFPTTPGAPQPKHSGLSDAFLAKFSLDGSKLLYSTCLGGAANEFAEHRLWLDADGSVLLTGVSASRDFPTTSGALQREPKGQNAGFLTRLSPDGKRFDYSTLLGGTGGGFWLMPTRDTAGNIYIVGTTSASGLPVTPDALQKTYGGGAGDGALAILSPDGAKLLYCTYLGGSGDDLIRGLALGPKGEIYLTGSTSSRDFPVTPGALQKTYGGGSADVFVVKLEKR